jgi:hypothetical protein
LILLWDRPKLTPLPIKYETVENTVTKLRVIDIVGEDTHHDIVILAAINQQLGGHGPLGK